MCKKMSYPERSALVKQAIREAIEYRDGGIAYFRKEPSMIEMFRSDCKDLKKVYSLFKRGKYKEACSFANQMDTAAREGINDQVWKEIHNES